MFISVNRYWWVNNGLMTSLPRNDLYKYGWRVREIYRWLDELAPMPKSVIYVEEGDSGDFVNYIMYFSLCFASSFIIHKRFFLLTGHSSLLAIRCTASAGIPSCYKNCLSFCVSLRERICLSRPSVNDSFLGPSEWLLQPLQCWFPIIRYQQGSLTKIGLLGILAQSCCGPFHSNGLALCGLTGKKKNPSTIFVELMISLLQII